MSLEAFLVSFLTVIASAMIAWREGNFSAKQMAARGIKNGLPFLRHTAMWGDLFLVTPAIGIMGKYSAQWKSNEIWIALFVAAIVTITLHIVWSKMTTIQEHILGPNLTYTASGLIHLFYQTGAVAVILLFCINTPLVQSRDVWIVHNLLLTQIPIGTVLVGYMKNKKFSLTDIIGAIALMIGLTAFTIFKVH